MSKLLEILGRAIAVNTAGLMWQWIDINFRKKPELEPMDEVINLVSLASFDIAAEKIEKYLLERPNCAVGRMAAAAICLENNQLQACLENLQSVYLRQPSNTLCLYVMGHCYERLGKQAEAVEFYQDCLKFKSFLELPRLRLAAIYFKNGQIEKAINEYTQQHKEYPDDIETLVLLGQLYIKNGHYQNAIDSFNNAILIHPDNFIVTPEEAKIKEITEYGSFQEACDYVNELLQTQPDSAELYVQLGDITAQQGNTADAIVHYEKAARLQPHMLQAFVKLGSLHLSQGNVSLAAELFNRAAAINDEIVDAYYGLAQSQLKTADTASAYSTLLLGATIQQNSVILFAEAARLRFCAAGNITAGSSENAKNSFADMFENFRMQSIAEPENQSMQYALGLLYMKVGMYEKAGELFRQIVTKNPTHYRALSRLAICYAEQDNRTKAVKCLKAEPAINRETLELHYKTSLLYCNRSGFINALRTTKQQLEDNFDAANAVNALNESLQNMGLLDRAYVCWGVINEIAHTAGK